MSCSISRRAARYLCSPVFLLSCLLLSTHTLGNEPKPIELKVKLTSASCNYLTRVVLCSVMFEIIDRSQDVLDESDRFLESEYVTVRLLNGLHELAELEPTVVTPEKNHGYKNYRFDDSQVWTLTIPYRSSSHPYAWHLTSQDRKTLAFWPNRIYPESLDRETAKYLRTRALDSLRETRR